MENWKYHWHVVAVAAVIVAAVIVAAVVAAFVDDVGDFEGVAPSVYHFQPGLQFSSRSLFYF